MSSWASKVINKDLCCSVLQNRHKVKGQWTHLIYLLRKCLKSNIAAECEIRKHLYALMSCLVQSSNKVVGSKINVIVSAFEILSNETHNFIFRQVLCKSLDSSTKVDHQITEYSRIYRPAKVMHCGKPGSPEAYLCCNSVPCYCKNHVDFQAKT